MNKEEVRKILKKEVEEIENNFLNKLRAKMIISPYAYVRITPNYCKLGVLNADDEPVFNSDVSFYHNEGWTMSVSSSSSITPKKPESWKIFHAAQVLENFIEVKEYLNKAIEQYNKVFEKYKSYFVQ